MPQAIITPSFVLTTEHAASSYGLPVLVNRTSQAAYGPKDILDLPPSTGGMQPAAHFVARFGTIGPEDPVKHELILAFLSQWPEGPQLR